MVISDTFVLKYLSVIGWISGCRIQEKEFWLLYVGHAIFKNVPTNLVCDILNVNEVYKTKFNILMQMN